MLIRDFQKLGALPIHASATGELEWSQAAIDFQVQYIVPKYLNHIDPCLNGIRRWNMDVQPDCIPQIRPSILSHNAVLDLMRNCFRS
jgi:hypothetical protein